jgi:hypothetical protein
VAGAISQDRLYEKLGGVARSNRTVAQRQAPKKAAATRAAKEAEAEPTLVAE